MPVLSRNEEFDYKVVKEEVIRFLDRFIHFSSSEQTFIEHFNSREYRPDVLFGEGELADRVTSHPMALWKCRPREESKN